MAKEKLKVGDQVKIKTACLEKFGQDPLKEGPLQGRLEVEFVRDYDKPAEDGSTFECRLRVSKDRVIAALESEVTVVIRA